MNNFKRSKVRVGEAKENENLADEGDAEKNKLFHF